MRFDLSGFARGGREHSHAELLSLCEEAERLDYRGIWFNEFHFQTPVQAYPSIPILAASVFARTTRLRVGASAVVTPLRHPLLLAEEIAQLHWQSGGRFDLGMGRGTHPDTLSALGLEAEVTRERFETAFDVLRQAWTQGVARPGDKGVSAPLLAAGERVPVYVAGTSGDTLLFAARHKLPLLLSLDPPEGGQLDTCAAIEAEHGFATAHPETSLCRYVCIAPTRAQADEKLDRLLPLFHARRVAAARAAGRDISKLSQPDSRSALETQFLAGSPDDCVRQVRRISDETGFTSMRLVFNGNGVIGWDEALLDMRLFALTVLPAFDI